MAALVVSVAMAFLGCGGDEGGSGNPGNQGGGGGGDSGGQGTGGGSNPGGSSGGSSTGIQPGSQFNPNISYGTLYDSRDGKRYRTVKIGDQTWMAENLNYNASGSVCYKNSSSNCDLYGRLYTWASAMDISTSYNTRLWNGKDVNHRGICPSGWHIPSDAEWTILTDYVGGKDEAGTKLKSKSGWDYYNGQSGGGTDEYGFSALPGGWRWIDGRFDGVDIGFWWSATEDDAEYAWFRSVDYYGKYVYRDYEFKPVQYSLRCVEDV